MEAEILLSLINWMNLFKGIPVQISNAAIKKAYADSKNLGSIMESSKVPSTPEFDYEKILDLVNNPDVYDNIINSLAEQNKPFAESLPMLASNAVAVIQEMMPINQSEDIFGETLLPPSDLEIRKFNRKLAILEDPYRIYDLIKSNMLSYPEIEALNIFYPELSAKIKQDALEQAMENKDKLSRDRKNQLAILFGVDSFSRASVRDLQSQYGGQEQQKGSSKKLDLKTTPTVGQRMAE